MNTKDKELIKEIKEYLDMVEGDESLIVDELYFEKKAELKGRKEARQGVLKDEIKFLRNISNMLSINEDLHSVNKCIEDIENKLKSLGEKK